MGGNHHEELGLRRISCPSQFTIPDTPGTSSEPAHNYTDTRSSQPNHSCCAPDFSNLVVFSRSFSSPSPISLFLILNSTIIAEHNVKSSLSMSPCQSHELTPSTAYTKDMNAPSTASTEDCVSSFHSHDYKLTPECDFRFRRAFPTPSSAISQLSIMAQR